MSQSLPRPFIGLAWSNLAAQSAEQLSLAAMPIVAVLLLGAGPGEVGLLGTAQTLPFLLLSIPLGLWADRNSRLRLMVWSEVVRLLTFIGLLAVAVSAAALTLLLRLHEPQRAAAAPRHVLLGVKRACRALFAVPGSRPQANAARAARPAPSSSMAGRPVRTRSKLPRPGTPTAMY